MTTLRDLGLTVGTLRPGPGNRITDVPGVTVGHATLADGPIQTGVTVIRPHPGDLFREKLPAAVHVFNGFGKSVGLVQMEELGQIETPIALTNTFAVGTASTALIRHAVAANPAIGRETSTINPVVLECNDGFLNDLHAFAVREEHVAAALAAAAPDFAQGAVGAGRGMSCFGLKGGIGSASRQVDLAGGVTLGALVLANFGARDDLVVAGRPVGRALDGKAPAGTEAGSIIMVILTDAPLDPRQLGRLARRAGVGLARTGSFIGHGSGDIAVAVSTAERIAHDEARDRIPAERLAEHRLQPLFRAVAESVEEAILKALLAAETVTGRDGHRRRALLDLPAARAALGLKP